MLGGGLAGSAPCPPSAARRPPRHPGGATQHPAPQGLRRLPLRRGARLAGRSRPLARRTRRCAAHPPSPRHRHAPRGDPPPLCRSLTHPLHPRRGSAPARCSRRHHTLSWSSHQLPHLRPRPALACHPRRHLHASCAPQPFSPPASTTSAPTLAPPGRHNTLVAFKLYLRLAPAQHRELGSAIELTLFPGGYAGLQPVEPDHLGPPCQPVPRARAR